VLTESNITNTYTGLFAVRVPTQDMTSRSVELTQCVHNYNTNLNVQVPNKLRLTPTPKKLNKKTVRVMSVSGLGLLSNSLLNLLKASNKTPYMKTKEPAFIGQ
jgi:hypothetical protein